ncbi:CLUMA_CG016686, isoform A [Clunio marinus]|uniref:CLUMA_CG016686, isoform A n=1 Tax=Clunio marinus TaxID=568069 RepID=A0A1J1ITV4_9DIPT|nr:CLUMA_CG016686, isoform A [Clunio marinus]
MIFRVSWDSNSFIVLAYYLSIKDMHRIVIRKGDYTKCNQCKIALTEVLSAELNLLNFLHPKNLIKFSTLFLPSHQHQWLTVTTKFEANKTKVLNR